MTNTLYCSLFLQRVSIACYAERCISHDRFCLSDRLAVRHTLVSCQNDSSYDHAVYTGDSPMTLVSSTLDLTAKFQREHGERGRQMRAEKGRKNRQFLANKSPYLRKGAR